MLRQLGVSVGFQFILMDIIRHLVCSLTIIIIILGILVTWCIFLQNSQSTATSVMIQLPSRHAAVQQKQTGVGKLT